MSFSLSREIGPVWVSWVGAVVPVSAGGVVGPAGEVVGEGVWAAVGGKVVEAPGDEVVPLFPPLFPPDLPLSPLPLLLLKLSVRLPLPSPLFPLPVRPPLPLLPFLPAFPLAFPLKVVGGVFELVSVPGVGEGIGDPALPLPPLPLLLLTLSVRLPLPSPLFPVAR